MLHVVAVLPPIQQGQQASHQQGNHQRKPENLTGYAGDFQPYVFQVNPSADDPAPGLKAFNVRELWNNSLRIVLPLPEIVQAVRTFEGVDVSDSRAFVAANQDDSKALVMMDGGVRRGADIYKALCLGARAVLLGRPVLWGLAMDGANGVEAVLKILYAELVLTIQLSGAPSLNDLTRDCVKSQF